MPARESGSFLSRLGFQVKYYQVRARVAVPFPPTRRLDLPARFYGTDKSSRAHGYTRLYESHLASQRRRIKSVLEIGIGGVTSRTGFDTPAGGQSLKMWRSYFPHAHIVGIDIEPKAVRGRRISTECGSQGSPGFLRQVAEKYGPFDVIIDDGSHVAEHVVTSFETLFDHLKPGGVYVIEDLEHAYLTDYGGGPPGSQLGHMKLIKGLLDDVLRQHWDDSGSARAIASVHVYDEIAFVHKAGRGARARPGHPWNRSATSLLRRPLAINEFRELGCRVKMNER